MSYAFDIIGISSVLQFFNHQQRSESNPRRSKAYLGSHICTLDSFIEAADMTPQKPDWDWNEVVAAMVQFWINQEAKVRYWKFELEQVGKDNLIVARVANYDSLRNEFEGLFDA